MSREIFEKAQFYLSENRLDDARTILTGQLQLDPRNVSLLYLLGVTNSHSSQFIEATECFKKTIEIDPKFPNSYYALGTTYLQLDDPANAVDSLRQYLRLQPDDLDGIGNLCNALIGIGKQEEAISTFRKLLSKNSGNPDLLLNFGILLFQLNKFEDALPVFRKAILANPNMANAHLNLSAALLELDKIEEATSSINQAIRLEPKSADAHFIFGTISEKIGDFSHAQEKYRSAITQAENYLPAYINLGKLLVASGESKEAIQLYNDAISNGLSSVELYNNLGNALASLGHLAEAEKNLQHSIDLNAKFEEAHFNLGNCLSKQGRGNEALEIIRQGLSINPNHFGGGSNFLMTLNYLPSTTEKELYDESRSWAHRFEFKNQINESNLSSEPNRKIKIGYLSPDFRTHSVSYFFEPLLTSHDRDHFEIYCYANVVRPDTTTARLEKKSDYWRSIVSLTDQAVAELVIDDNIDILIDLAGHTAGNRLNVFTMNPAPIQVNWLGYPGTTGLSSMDYRLTDVSADPVGKSDDYHVEKLLRLNTFLCYSPPPDAPDVAKLPFDETDHITFGSFNNLAKLTPNMIEVWSQILKQIPHSLLHLKCKSFACDETKNKFMEHFSSQGIAKNRLTFLPETSSTKDHLAEYNRIDIGLDTFPYHGTTTTFEALWMGVPVVVLTGDRHASRVGTSILNSLDMENWTANDETQYINIAKEMANSTSDLRSQRSNLRKRMKNSILMNHTAFAENFENTIRQIWQEWCQTQS
jgi:protein O-GlcNAc transferase